MSVCLLPDYNLQLQIISSNSFWSSLLTVCSTEKRQLIIMILTTEHYSFPYSEALKYSPCSSKYSINLFKNLSPLTVSVSHTRQHCLLARVTATFILLLSLRNPTSFFEFDQTIEMIMASFSRPWKPSTVEISISFNLSSLLLSFFKKTTCAA